MRPSLSLSLSHTDISPSLSSSLSAEHLSLSLETLAPSLALSLFHSLSLPQQPQRGPFPVVHEAAMAEEGTGRTWPLYSGEAQGEHGPLGRAPPLSTVGPSAADLAGRGSPALELGSYPTSQFFLFHRPPRHRFLLAHTVHTH